MKRSAAYEEGENDFVLGEDPRVHLRGKGYSLKEQAQFLNGWHDARRTYETGHKEETEFDSFSSNCPWQYFGGERRCSAVGLSCSKENCALIYFKENYDWL
jgi:hypothetical protein